MWRAMHDAREEPIELLPYLYAYLEMMDDPARDKAIEDIILPIIGLPPLSEKDGMDAKKFYANDAVILKAATELKDDQVKDILSRGYGFWESGSDGEGEKLPDRKTLDETIQKFLDLEKKRLDDSNTAFYSLPEAAPSPPEPTDPRPPRAENTATRANQVAQETRAETRAAPSPVAKEAKEAADDRVEEPPAPSTSRRGPSTRAKERPNRAPLRPRGMIGGNGRDFISLREAVKIAIKDPQYNIPTVVPKSLRKKAEQAALLVRQHRAKSQ